MTSLSKTKQHTTLQNSFKSRRLMFSRPMFTFLARLTSCLENSGNIERTTFFIISVLFSNRICCLTIVGSHYTSSYQASFMAKLFGPCWNLMVVLCDSEGRTNQIALTMSVPDIIMTDISIWKFFLGHEKFGSYQDSPGGLCVMNNGFRSTLRFGCQCNSLCTS